MNHSSPTRTSLRRVVRWLLICTGVCLLPFLIIAIVAISYYRLDRNAAVLRQQVMAATDSDWSTKVQINVGQPTLNAAKFGLRFVRDKKMADAKLALGAIKRASVGVYEHSSLLSAWSKAELIAHTDQAMRKRGWLRLVGVFDAKDTILIYVPQDTTTEDEVEICLAVVVSDKNLVVASTKVDGQMLSELMNHHIAHDLAGKLLPKLDSFRG